MLQTETITIDGTTFTLGEHTLYIDFKRSDLINKAIEENKTDDDIARQLMRIGYVNLTAAIVNGTPPTFDDVLFRVSTEDTTRWSDAARRLNPQWFPAASQPPVDPETAAIEQKKEAQTWEIYAALTEKEGNDDGDVPLILDEVETLTKLMPLYVRWLALGRPMTLNDLLNYPAWLIDGLLTLEWVSQKVNKKKE